MFHMFHGFQHKATVSCPQQKLFTVWKASYLEVDVIVILAMPFLHAYQRHFDVDVGDFMIRYRQCVDGGVLLHDRLYGQDIERPADSAIFFPSPR